MSDSLDFQWKLDKYNFFLDLLIIYANTTPFITVLSDTLTHTAKVKGILQH